MTENMATPVMVHAPHMHMNVRQAVGRGCGPPMYFVATSSSRKAAHASKSSMRGGRRMSRGVSSRSDARSGGFMAPKHSGVRNYIDTASVTSSCRPRKSAAAPSPKYSPRSCLPALVPAYLAYSGQSRRRDWRTASREPAGLAPDPATTREAVVQVYSARAVSWRGWFGVHTWIAVKPRDASEFTVHEVMGWRLKRTGTALVARNRPADGYWYGNPPGVVRRHPRPRRRRHHRRIEAAVKEYPYPDRYHVWPGPNSNTFIAFVLRRVPELRVDMPPTAIGKDYLGWRSVNTTPSGTGGQASLFGLVGVAAGLEEGLEVNLLGLNFGVDPKSLSIKLPIVGRLGPETSDVRRCAALRELGVCQSSSQNRTGRAHCAQRAPALSIALAQA